MVSAPNDNLIETKWEEIKEEVQREWNLTDQEMARVNGDLSVLTTLIESKYGTPPQRIRAELDELTAEFRRELKEEEVDAPLNKEQDGVRDHLREQFRQF